MKNIRHIKIENFLFRASVLVIAVAACIAFYYFYLVFFPEKIIVYKNIPFPVETKNVRPGERVIVDINYCKYSNITPITRVVTMESDINSIPITTIVKKLPFGCHNHYRYDGYIIPIGIPVGKYYISATIVYPINNFSRVSATYYTQKFNVIN